MKKTQSLNRAVDAVMGLLVQRDVEDVSVAAIAAAAHCSTATIYDAYGTKEELLLEAFERGRRRWEIRIATYRGDETSFCDIIEFLDERIQYVGSAFSIAALKTFIAGSVKDTERMNWLLTQQDQVTGIAQLAAGAMRTGHLREADDRTLAYVLLTSSSFEPLVMGLLFSEGVNRRSLIHTVLAPHVTDLGAEVVDQWLKDSNASGDEAGDFEGPIDPSMGLLGAHRLNYSKTLGDRGKQRRL